MTGTTDLFFLTEWLGQGVSHTIYALEDVEFPTARCLLFFYPYECVKFLYHFNPMFFVSVLYAIELNRIYFHGAIIAYF
jgi:hypothetical protein